MGERGQGPESEGSPEQFEQQKREWAQQLYDFLTSPNTEPADLEPADAIVTVVPGNAFWSSAEYAADLYKLGKSPLLVMSGGSERNQRWVTSDEKDRKIQENTVDYHSIWDDDTTLSPEGGTFRQQKNSEGNVVDWHWILDQKVRECDAFAWKAIDKGVPDEDILREPAADNTPTNYAFSMKALAFHAKERGEQPPRRVIIVTYVEEARRNFHTATRVLGQLGIDFTITALKRDFTKTYEANPDKKILDWMASLCRLYVYGDAGKGDIAIGLQDFPYPVLAAYRNLRDRGFRIEDDPKYAGLVEDMRTHVGGDVALATLFEQYFAGELLMTKQQWN